MKLISLYIENFGGLSRYELDFADGLTVIEAENGFGKTTLAEFIRLVMASNRPEEEKERMILCGIRALSGEEVAL